MLNTHHQKQAALSSSWTARLRHLEVALAESPDSVQAWHWHAQIKVLRFVTSRYGDETELPTLRTKNEPLPDFELPKPPKPPMPLAKMQQILGHVQEINRLKPNEPLPRDTLPDGSPAPIRLELSQTRSGYSLPEGEAPSFLNLILNKPKLSRSMRIAAILCHLLIYLLLAAIFACCAFLYA
ncbi:MAG TPA: hypothetical protein VGB77_04705 [Abditibacteriaceae bacterium]|jgi:hypothetical protein